MITEVGVNKMTETQENSFLERPSSPENEKESQAQPSDDNVVAADSVQSPTMSNSNKIELTESEENVVIQENEANSSISMEKEKNETQKEADNVSQSPLDTKAVEVSVDQKGF